MKFKKYLNAYYDVRLAKEWNGREIHKRYESDTEEKEGKEKYSLGIIWIIFFLHFPAFFHSHALLSLFAYYTYCLLDKHHSNSGEAVRSLLLPTMEQMHNVLWLYPLENDDNNNEYIFFSSTPTLPLHCSNLAASTARHSSDKWTHDPGGRISFERVNWEVFFHI